MAKSTAEKLLVKTFVLTFPSKVVREPITTKLVRDYDMSVNIMRAMISPDEQGHMVVELSGTKENLDRGMLYLKRIGVTVQPLAQDVRWTEERCTHCTACISVCPTDALIVNRKTMSVHFEVEKCIGCGLCIPVCSYGAMEVSV